MWLGSKPATDHAIESHSIEMLLTLTGGGEGTDQIELIKQEKYHRQNKQDINQQVEVKFSTKM